MPVPAVRLATTGFGDTRPVEDDATEEGRARNRRVEPLRQ
jgi:OOP family OmpA-OmpF porin